MDGKIEDLKKEKKNPRDKSYETSEQISSGIIDGNAKEGEAAEMVKGLGYSDHAYEAAKARLDQKYGGNRPQVQAYIDELRKMRPINADNPRVQTFQVHHIAEKNAFLLINCKILVTRSTEKQTLLLVRYKHATIV